MHNQTHRTNTTKRSYALLHIFVFIMDEAHLVADSVLVLLFKTRSLLPLTAHLDQVIIAS